MNGSYNGVLKKATNKQGSLKAAVYAAASGNQLSNNTLSTEDLINSSLSPTDGDYVSTNGYVSSGDGGAGDWVFEGVTGQTPSQSPAQQGSATLTDVNGNVWSLVSCSCTARREFSTTALGALFDGVSDDRLPIQAAINSASIVSGSVLLGVGTAMLSIAGELNSFKYCLQLFSNMELIGSGQRNTTLKLIQGDDATILLTDRVNPVDNLTLLNFGVDGNYLVQPDVSTGFGIWVHNGSNITLEGVLSKNCVDFGYRIEGVNTLSFGNIISDQGEAETSDGFHLIDCSNVTGNRLRITTRGDDGFVIEANNQDTHDISISDIVIDTPVTGLGAGKGVYLVNSAANGAAGIERNIYNINLPNVVTYNCAATALILERAHFSNIKVGLVDTGSFRSFGALIGDTAGAGVSGSIVNSDICVSSDNCTDSSTFFTQADGVVENCKFNILSRNSADGVVANLIYANDSEINVNVNQNPNGDKLDPKQSILLRGNGNRLSAICDGGNTNIRIEGSDNTINPKSKNSTIRDIELISGSDNNIFTSGSVTSGVSNAGSGNAFYSIYGLTSYDNITDTTNGSGNITVAHGLVAAPSVVTANILGDNTYDCEVQTVNATNIVFRIRDTTDNSDLASQAVTVMFSASV